MTIHVNLPEKMPTGMVPYLIQHWPLFESVRGELAHLDKILESTLICVLYSSRIRTLVAMVTLSFHRLVMGKVEISYFLKTIAA